MDNKFENNNYYQAGNPSDKIIDADEVTIEDMDGKQSVKKKKKIHFKMPHMKKGTFGNKLMKCTAMAAAFGLVAGVVFSGSSSLLSSVTSTDSETSSETSATSLSNSDSTTVESTDTSDSTTVSDVSTVVENVMPSIVAITTVSVEEYANMFGQSESYESEGAGSGIIISQDDDYLYIATNNHVVEGATSLTVQFVDDSTVSAEIQGTDSDSDLAVVKVAISDIDSATLSEIKVATLGDSTSLSVGDSAIAIGNALGYGQSVTTGVISAVDREVTTTDDTTGESVTNTLIQTDAAINPGNSGGALINSNGEVIGINSSKYADTDVEGMGFAIPISDASPILEELIANGSASDSSEGGDAYLGIAGVDVTSEIAQNYNMPQGAYISQVVSGSAAEDAGLTEGMIVTAINGETISSFEELSSYISSASAGDEVTLTVAVANGQEYSSEEVKVTLGTKAN
ncbi:MAG: trypsin-like peptidase domain-containing protein [Eubacterium sp.]|nr:trypsin-like peptidase domain-containing protein [Eubacterium sp.]